MESNGQQASKTIPHFASFRPEVLPTPAAKPNESSGAKESRSSDHRLTRVAISRQHANKWRSPSIAFGRGDNPLRESKQHYEDWAGSSATFTLDVKGDFRNLHYGSNHGPSYPRPPTRVALGSEFSLGSNAQGPASSGHRIRSISKRIIPNLRRQTLKRVKAGPKVDQDDGKSDFIPLQWPKSGNRKQEHRTKGHTSFWNMGTSTHQRIEGEVESTPNSDEDTENITDEAESDREGPGVSVLDPHLQRKRAALSRKLEQDPTDWRAWVELVKLQDEMDGFLHDYSQVRHTNAERQSNAEIALSMCNKALRSVINPEGRERLYLCQMSKAPQVWERGKILLRWQPILREHPSSHQLWKKFLDFNQAAFAGFNLEEIRKKYLDCIGMLQAIRERLHVESAQQSTIFSLQLYILLRLTLLLREADYAELGVAMWQALLEFQFNKPQQTHRTSQQAAIKSTYRDLVSAFEQFWNSETPRIGEPNAKGWRNFDDNEHEYEQPPEIVETLLQAESATFVPWSQAEREAASTSRTPSRSIDKSSDDPFRVAFFLDIKSALIESPTLSEIPTILLAFLRFCHLPPYLDSSRLRTGLWFSDQFIHNEVLYDESLLAAFSRRGSRSMSPSLGNTMLDANISNSLPPAPFDFPLAEHQISPDTLFSSSPGWFSAFRVRTQVSRPILEKFALRTLRFLVDNGIGGDDLAEYLLALELQVSPGTVKKSAKSLLKAQPSSLRLYNAYALVQHQLGKREEANTVLDTAIRMSATLDESARRDVLLLWRSRIWQSLSSGETSIALGQLLRFEHDNDAKGRPDDKDKTLDVTSITPRLRLREVLSAGRDHMLSLGFTTHAVYYAELLVILEYLQEPTSLQTAQETFRVNLGILTQNTLSNRTSEALFRQSFARLLYTHVIHKRPFSPVTIRSFLAESITVFPQNTIFLSLYAWNESRFRIDDRVRGIMQDVVFAYRHHDRRESDGALSNSIIPHFFAVYTDLRRDIAQGSNQNAIRGSFERAIRSEDAAHSASLWKLYFLFEHGNGDMKRTREIFYRAVRACPWVKEIYMMAFDYFVGIMSEEELRGVYEMMTEKELRVHVAL
ncbi:MAG: hypothetical protein Q9216_001199 [Gyalolechia sp. 2 TL-2023]